MDLTNSLERLVERFAPGFRDCILARRSTTARELEIHNPNNPGGDIAGGLSDLPQLFLRPVAKLDRAAQTVLRRAFGRTIGASES